MRCAYDFGWLLIVGLVAVSCKTSSRPPAEPKPSPAQPADGYVRTPPEQRIAAPEDPGFAPDTPTKAGLGSAIGLPGSSCAPSAPAGNLLSGSPPKVWFDDAQLLTRLSDAALRQVCEASHGVFFVGNGEQLGELVFRNPELVAGERAAIKEEFARRGRDFYAAIKEAAAGFGGPSEDGRGLASNRCWQLYEERHLPTSALASSRLLLVKVLDGPGMGDSQVTTTLYQWQSGRWQPTTNDWQLSNDRLQPASGGPWELYLPKQLNQVVLEALHLFPGPNSLASYDNHVYFFKTHGGLLPAAGRRRSPLLSDLPAEGQPVLLFDGHPKQALADQEALRSPFWGKFHACRIWQYLDPQRFANAGCTGSGPTSDTGGTAGVDGATCNTAGTGKGLLLRGNDELFAAVAPSEAAWRRCRGDGCLGVASRGALAPDGYIRLAPAVTYDTDWLPSPAVSGLRLIPGRSPLNTAADVVILDSCYGMKSVLRSLIRARQDPSDRSGSGRKLVALWGPNPLYYRLFEYEMFTTSRMMLLGYLLGFDPHQQVQFPFAAEAAALEELLHSGNLCPCACSSAQKSPACEGQTARFPDCSGCQLQVDATFLGAP